MSSPLAIAAVTAALKDLLNDGLLNHDLSQIGSFTVTSTPPDRITTGETEPNQLNLFLYQGTKRRCSRAHNYAPCSVAFRPSMAAFCPDRSALFPRSIWPTRSSW